MEKKVKQLLLRNYPWHNCVHYLLKDLQIDLCAGPVTFETPAQRGYMTFASPQSKARVVRLHREGELLGKCIGSGLWSLCRGSFLVSLFRRAGLRPVFI